MTLIRRVDVFGAESRGLKKIASQDQTFLLKEAAAPLDTGFDIFLSHSYANATEIRHLKTFLAEFGFAVYVDWVDDDELSRGSVTSETAYRLRTRITRSRCLLVYATSDARSSRWMPWELGYADGMGKYVGILPVVSNHVLADDYQGSEYLALCPYIDHAENLVDGRPHLWANRAADVYVEFGAWLEGWPLRRRPTNVSRRVPRRASTHF